MISSSGKVGQFEAAADRGDDGWVCEKGEDRSPQTRNGIIWGSSGEPREQGEPGAVEHPDISLDQANVPQDLRDLIPFAEQWGIGDDVIRSRYEESVSGEEKERFRSALAGRTTRVTEWLDSFEDGLLSEEAGTFMYMLEALDEMGIWPD